MLLGTRIEQGPTVLEHSRNSGSSARLGLPQQEDGIRILPPLGKNLPTNFPKTDTASIKWMTQWKSGRGTFLGYSRIHGAQAWGIAISREMAESAEKILL